MCIQKFKFDFILDERANRTYIFCAYLSIFQLILIYLSIISWRDISTKKKKWK